VCSLHKCTVTCYIVVLSATTTGGVLPIRLYQPVREAISYRELFTVDWFGVREKHGSRLEIYDRLRASEQAVYQWQTHSRRSGSTSLE